VSDPRSDEELFDQARRAFEGDSRAFEALVLRYQGKVVANCRYVTRMPSDAEDLAQEVFVKAFFGMDRFEGRSSFRTWLQRIKVNHCLNHMKKKQGRSFVDVDELAGGEKELSTPSIAERGLEREDDRQTIGQVLDTMSDALRIPLILRDFDQLSYQEIADALGVGLSAVKMRIKRAREEFRQRYRVTSSGPEVSP
jgi:RNA polymerase sigma-70 factor (ECF subfamily)